ncbi:hypothetical protein C9E85_16150 [Plesiomonas shigelloides]|uniref:hypothetical protein n=1 Tax=Plesiomonas shigelloides TaxID=703 RepID=UPI000D570C86|nr:hypothetical protein [Plesiomonas shigelloides]PVU64829.1 hypothetical protein C9E85_16150 [Plesiomonas shigelloides]
MIKSIYQTIFFVLALFTLGCSSQPERVVNTKSGWPEVYITTNDKSEIVKHVIARNVKNGWVLDEESENTISFEYIDTSGSFDSIMYQSLLGNAYSTAPKYETKYTIANSTKGNGEYFVVVNTSVSVQMAGGKVNRVYLKENNTLFNAIQKQLNSIKSDVEVEPSKT